MAKSRSRAKRTSAAPKKTAGAEYDVDAWMQKAGPACKRVFEIAKQNAFLTEADASNIAFHMTDWLSDLYAFHRFCEKPESGTDDEVAEMLHGFLIHVPNHVAAAAKLLTDEPVRDIFEVGAVEVVPNRKARRPKP